MTYNTCKMSVQRFRRKWLIVTIIFLYSVHQGYTQEFPQSWEGEWNGEMNIYNSKSVDPVMNLQMELKVEPITDSAWSWTIVYITADKPDLRAYELQATDDPNKWIIDEKNGIQLPQTYIGNRLTSSFSLENTLLVASYWLEDSEMNFEIIVTNLEPESETGLGNETSPIVGNHPVNTYQRAILKKVSE